MNLAAWPIPKLHRAPMALVAVVAALILAVYLQTLQYPFISDDIVYIIRNTRLAELHPAGLWRLFTEPYNDLSEFLPLRDLSYWFDIHLFGPTPSVLRLHNFYLYLCCFPLVYGATLGFWRYFRPADEASAPWAAAAVTALFALHPAHVEAVVWVSGRKDILSCLFALFALWLTFIAKRERRLSSLYAAATLLALLAAILSKATAVAVAPVIILLWLIFWREIPLPARRKSQLLWPLAGLLLAALTAVIFTASSTVKDPIYFGAEAITRMLAVLGWLARLSISPESRHFYYPVFEDAYLSFRIALGVAVLVAAAAGTVAILRKKYSLEGFAAVTFLLLCMPYTQLLPYDTDSLVSDRFLALAVWPVSLLLVALTWRLRPVHRAVLLIAIALVWGFQTMERPRDWRNFETLIDADMRAYPGYYMPAVYKITSYQLPQGLYREADIAANRITTTEFRDIMNKMIRVHYAIHAGPADARKLQYATTLLWELGKDIKQPPAQSRWNSPVKNLWIKLPYILAIEWRSLSVRYPGDVSVNFNAGLWMLEAKRYQDAEAYLRDATNSQDLPKQLRGIAYGSLGLAMMNSGDFVEAEAPLRAALKQSPPNLQAYCTLSEMYKKANRMAEAKNTEAGCRGEKGEGAKR